MIFFVIFQKVTKITVLYFTSRRRYIAETASTTKVSIFGLYICVSVRYVLLLIAYAQFSLKHTHAGVSSKEF